MESAIVRDGGKLLLRPPPHRRCMLLVMMGASGFTVWRIVVVRLPPKMDWREHKHEREHYHTLTYCMYKVLYHTVCREYVQYVALEQGR